MRSGKSIGRNGGNWKDQRWYFREKERWNVDKAVNWIKRAKIPKRSWLISLRITNIFCLGNLKIKISRTRILQKAKTENLGTTRELFEFVKRGIVRKTERKLTVWKGFGKGNGDNCLRKQQETPLYKTQNNQTPKRASFLKTRIF